MLRSNGSVRIALTASVFLLCTTLISHAERPIADAGQAAPSALIEGLVTEGPSGSGRSVSGATVVLVGNGSARSVGRVTTDAKGVFKFQPVPVPCNCEVRASRGGYFEATSGEPGGESFRKRFVLSDGQRVSGVQIQLTPLSNIAGRIVDKQGHPIVGVPVRIIRRTEDASGVHVIAGAATTTNDRGDYQFTGLRSGDYIVSLPAVQSTIPEDVRPEGNANVNWESAGSGVKLRVGPYPPSLSRSSREPMAIPTLYFPGTPLLSEATPITVPLAGDRSGIDIVVEPAKVFRIAGRITALPESSPALTIRLLPRGSEDLGLGSETATAMTDRSGAFALVNVPAGEYVLDVNRSAAQLEDLAALMTVSSIPMPPGSEKYSFVSTAVRLGSVNAQIRSWSSAGDRWWARQPVRVVDRDLNGVTVPVTRAAVLDGRIVADDGQPLDAALLGSVRLESAAANPAMGLPRGPAKNAGAQVVFSIDGILPGAYVLKVREVQRVKSILINGREFVNSEIEIGSTNVSDVLVTLNTKVTEISGTVALREGAGPESVAVVMFPVERDQWTRFGWSSDRMRLTPVAASGSYRIQNVQAGQYFVVAINASDAAEWRDVGFLQRASLLASRVTIAWGENQSVSPRILPKR